MKGNVIPILICSMSHTMCHIYNEFEGPIGRIDGETRKEVWQGWAYKSTIVGRCHSEGMIHRCWYLWPYMDSCLTCSLVIWLLVAWWTIFDQALLNDKETFEKEGLFRPSGTRKKVKELTNWLNQGIPIYISWCLLGSLTNYTHAMKHPHMSRPDIWVWTRTERQPWRFTKAISDVCDIHALYSTHVVVAPSHFRPFDNLFGSAPHFGTFTLFVVSIPLYRVPIYSLPLPPENYLYHYLASTMMNGTQWVWLDASHL